MQYGVYYFQQKAEAVMMRRTGTVVKDAEGVLKVMVERPTECERCGMCQDRKLLLDLPGGDWSEGDTVDIDMPADRVLRASALVYVLPLLLLFLGLLLGDAVGGALGMSAEGASILMGLALMALGFVGVKLISPHLKRKGALDMQMTPCGHSTSEIRAMKADDKQK